MGLPELVLQAQEHPGVYDLAPQGDGGRDSSASTTAAGSPPSDESTLAAKDFGDKVNDDEPKLYDQSKAGSGPEGKAPAGDGQGVRSRHGDKDSATAGLTQATNDIVPSVTLPASVNAELRQGSLRPEYTNRGTAPAVPTLHLPDSRPDESRTNADGDASGERRSEGTLDARKVQEVKRDLLAQSTAPVPDQLASATASKKREGSGAAGDYSANQQFLGLQVLPGGGKGVRHASFQSMVGHHGDIVDEPESLAPISEAEDRQKSAKQHANGKLLALLRPKARSQDSDVPTQVKSQAEEQAADKAHHVPLPDGHPLPPLMNSQEPGANHVNSTPAGLGAIGRSLSAPVSPHNSPKMPHVPLPRNVLAAATHQQGMVRTDTSTSQAGSKWSTLKSKLQRLGTNIPAPREEDERAADRDGRPRDLNMVDELMTGQMAVGMIRMIMERDEKGRGRVPVFLHHVRFKITDSIGGLSNHPVFRIECSYADGAVKWVIYRSLRDFLALHAHYKTAGIARVAGRSRWNNNREKVDLPEFPRSSIPYFKRKKNNTGSGDEAGAGKSAGPSRAQSRPPSVLQSPTTPGVAANGHSARQGSGNSSGPAEHETVAEALTAAKNAKGSHGGGGHQVGVGGHISGAGRGDFARIQREALETYLLGVRHAVMYRPESSHLIRFLELSSLTLQLAPRGGAQGKSGYLRVLSTNVSLKKDRPALRLIAQIKQREPKWWIVRESYMVAVEDPDQTKIFDVFMFDQDFTIERPNRVLRKTIGKAEKFQHEHDWANMTGEDDGGEENRLATLEGDIHGVDRATIDEANTGKNVSHHTFYVKNSQNRLKLVAKNVRQMQQFIVSLEKMAADSVWAGKNRFDSFAPIRLNVAAQWLVDGRDYLWNLSRALLLAKRTVYIHDWWLSPELYMRRPTQEKYRLDNILKKKAEEGVQIYVIVYNEVSNKTTPTDSLYTKKTLRDLHPNIHIQRSPSHFSTGTFYWSHHEKMCVIDEVTAFMGGVDLCFGRWDTPQHVLIDDDCDAGVHLGQDAPIWPGKDYSNPRVLDFHTLNKPFEDVYDREKVPRMPWHDVAMQMVGQPARDLSRHFIQRWNHLLRIKNHKVPMPFLVPPPDFTVRQLEEQGLTGTCEIQVTRSCGPWSMGTTDRVEHSIQNAYLKAIQLSEHFVYIENQFFITSTVVDGVEIENQIGDALVNRIIKAHEEGTAWRACIVIPLFPGYTYPIDSDQAASVRLIVECQNKSICRGPNSIFSRLRQEGIDPDDYISFFSLRGWGKFKSGVLTTEMVYIHGKTCIVDDRLVIIGSANINERSMRGDRDSELASVIRDTDMIDSTMAGKPYKVGRFAHTLRVRLMREHIGVDVDAMEDEDLLARDPIAREDEIQTWDPSKEQGAPADGVVQHRTVADRFKMHAGSVLQSVVHGQTQKVNRTTRKVVDLVTRQAHEVTQPDDDVEIFQLPDGQMAKGFASTIVPTMEERKLAAHNLIDEPLRRDEIEGHIGDIADAIKDATADGRKLDISKEDALDSITPDVARVLDRKEAVQVKEDAKKPLLVVGADKKVHDHETFQEEEVTTSPANKDVKAGQENKDPTGGGQNTRPPNRKGSKHPWIMPLPTPEIDPHGLQDPLSEKFWLDTWVSLAVHNTEIYRKVFRCVPDDLVTSWTHYRENASHAEKFNKPPAEGTVLHGMKQAIPIHGGPGTHGAGGGGTSGGVVGQGQGNDDDDSQPLMSDGGGPELGRSKSTKSRTSLGGAADDGPPSFSGPAEGWSEWEQNKMEELLGEIRGHLVVFPTRFLETEDLGNNFLFNADKIMPLPIYD